MLEGPIDLGSDVFQVVLVAAGQALSPGFVGVSANCQYSDLTDELPTAAGYTAGGVVLGSPTLTLAGATVIFDANTVSWTLTSGGITFKYAVIVDNTAPNKDLIFYCDMDTGGGSVSPIAGTMQIQPSAGGIETFT